MEVVLSVARKFCTSCASERSAAGGIWLQCNKTRRWKCASCAEKKTPSWINQDKEKGNAKSV